MRDETSYRTIAPYYDWIMAHVDYDTWGRHLGKLWRKFGIEPKSVLEIGAGTCPFARREIYPAGCQVIYSDLSRFMLAQAQDVAGIKRVAANALALPFRGPFQLCVMIYDAINYLMEEDDVARCFAEAYRILGQHGLFIFDITTEENSRRHFHQAVDFGEMEGCTYYRESSYDREAQLQSNDFVFFVEGKPECWRKIKESHQQRIYKIEQMRSWAENAGFIVAGVFEGFTFRAGRDTSERIHFVLRKP